MDMMLAPEDTGAALESTGEGGPNETTPGDAVDEDEAEGSAADKEEVATIKAERDIIQEIKRAELERERTGTNRMFMNLGKFVVNNCSKILGGELVEKQLAENFAAEDSSQVQKIISTKF